MPLRELRNPIQIGNWLIDWSGKIHGHATLILIGSGALLGTWHNGIWRFRYPRTVWMWIR